MFSASGCHAESRCRKGMLIHWLSDMPHPPEKNFGLDMFSGTDVAYHSLKRVIMRPVPTPLNTRIPVRVCTLSKTKTACATSSSVPQDQPVSMDPSTACDTCQPCNSLSARGREFEAAFLSQCSTPRPWVPANEMMYMSTQTVPDTLSTPRARLQVCRNRRYTSHITAFFLPAAGFRYSITLSTDFWYPLMKLTNFVRYLPPTCLSKCITRFSYHFCRLAVVCGKAEKKKWHTLDEQYTTRQSLAQLKKTT